MINCSDIYCKKCLILKRYKDITPFLDGQARLIYRNDLIRAVAPVVSIKIFEYAKV
jgi:hypothetical protein